MRTKNNIPNKLTLGSKIGQLWLRCRPAGSIAQQQRYNLTISDQAKFIWFRNAKVATRSIYAHLGAQQFELSLNHPYGVYYDAGAYRDYFKFAFVRNPWLRILSAWQDKVVDNNYYGFSPTVLARMQDFGSFVDYLATLDLASDRCDQHIRMQTSLIDLAHIDFVGRMENLHEDFALVCKQLGIAALLERHNAAKYAVEQRDKYFTQEIRQKLGKLYRADISVFNYTYPFS